MIIIGNRKKFMDSFKILLCMPFLAATKISLCMIIYLGACPGSSILNHDISATVVDAGEANGALG